MTNKLTERIEKISIRTSFDNYSRSDISPVVRIENILHQIAINVIQLEDKPILTQVSRYYIIQEKVRKSHRKISFRYPKILLFNTDDFFLKKSGLYNIRFCNQKNGKLFILKAGQKLSS